MNHALRSLVLLAIASGLAAQTFTFPLDPRRTFLRTNNDTPQPPLVLDLAPLGAVPGTWLRIGTAGAYAYIAGGADNHRNLMGVFSADAQLLATTAPHRVPGAIAAGPAFVSAATYYGALATDIAQDFLASRLGWADSVLVEVPPGASRLFLGKHDRYVDNHDPNGDFAAVVTVLATPGLPGTGEHVELRSGLGGVGSGPDRRSRQAASARALPCCSVTARGESTPATTSPTPSSSCRPTTRGATSRCRWCRSRR